MKKHLKKISIMMLVMTFVLICGVFAGCTNYDKLYNDDSKIMSADNYSAKNLKQNVKTGVVEVSSSSFSGVLTLYTPFVVSDGMEGHLKLIANAGMVASQGTKLKVVLTNKYRVYTVATIGWTDSICSTDLTSDTPFKDIPNGEYSLKIVGVKADFTMSLTF